MRKPARPDHTPPEPAPEVPRAPLLLPPRPSVGGWCLAAAAAGAALGTAELAGLLLTGMPVRPELGLLLVTSALVCVALPGAMIGLVLGAADRSLCHSEMVAALLGPLLAAPALGALLDGLRRAAGWRDLLFALAAGSAAALVAVLAVRAARRLEAAGVWLPAIPVWGVACALLTGAERFVAGGATLPLIAALAAILGLLVTSLARSVRRSRQGQRPPPLSASRTLLLLLVVASATIAAPRALPWLSLDPDLPALPAGPSNVLLLVLPEPPSLARGEAGQPAASRPVGSGVPVNLALTLAEGVHYSRVPTGADLLASLLEVDPGASLLAELTPTGFATALVLGDPARPAPRGAQETDARAGDLALLEREAARTAGGGLLLALGPGTPLAGLLADRRRPSQLGSDARHWLRHWRTLRAHGPFALLVDYRGAPASANEDLALDAEVGRWREMLDDLEITGTTLVLLVFHGDAREDGRERDVQILARPPPGSVAPPPGVVVDRPVRASAFAEAIWRAVRDAPGHVLALPPASPASPGLQG